MSTTLTRGDRRVVGEMASGKASALWSLQATVAGAERPILLRVQRGGIHIGERELRYQLEHKDNHPLAQADELLNVLAEIEARGLLTAELCFRLTEAGRSRLADLDEADRRAGR
jgi:hypothetical protein